MARPLPRRCGDPLCPDPYCASSCPECGAFDPEHPCPVDMKPEEFAAWQDRMYEAGDGHEEPAALGGRRGTAADAEGQRRPEGRGCREVSGVEVDGGQTVESCRRGDALPSNADGERLEVGDKPHGGQVGPRLEAPRRGDVDRCHAVAATAWGQYEPAIRRWEAVLGRPAPAPTDEKGRLNPPFVEWMMGYPAGWVDGLARTAALKALGNAVVQQQAAAARRELAPLDRVA